MMSHFHEIILLFCCIFGTPFVKGDKCNHSLNPVSSNESRDSLNDVVTNMSSAKAFREYFTKY